MSIHRRIFFGAAASWFSRGLTILLGLVLMPVLFRTLGKEELGLWLLLGQSAAVLGILDFGFGVTLTRRLAFAKGKSGSDPAAVLGEESRTDIADLVSTGLRIYRVLALVAFVISFGLGFLYLRSLTLDEIPLATVWTAWAVLCLSQALMVWATPWTCLLQGVGHVGWDALIASFTGAATLVAQIVVALCGGGILALAITAAAGAVLQRTAILAFARRKQPDLFALRGRWRRDLFGEMVPLAWRAWLTALGTILVQNTDGFFIASQLSPEQIPPYRAAFIVVLNLHLIAGVFATSSSVFISQLWQCNNHEEIRKIVERNLRIALSIMTCGGAVILACSTSLFSLWLGPGNFIGGKVLTLLLITFTLEQHSYSLITSCRATEDEAFANWTLTGGILKILLSSLLIAPFGVVGLAFATMISQIPTYHWFVFNRSMNRLQIRPRGFLMKVTGPCLLMGLFVYFGIRAAVDVFTIKTDIATIFVSIAFGVGSLGVFLWFAVMIRHERESIMNRMNIWR